jgi:hypothetical protein
VLDPLDAHHYSHAGASSIDLFGHNKMRFASAPIIRVAPHFHLVGTQQSVGFRNGTFAVEPLGLDGIQSWAFHGQQTGHDPDPVPGPFRSLIMRPEPGPHQLAGVPRGVVPGTLWVQQPPRNTLRCQALAAPG